MTMPSITLRDLEYLVALAEHGHFGKAARAVHVSQPTLSGQTRKLEGVLGVTLFERTNRRRHYRGRPKARRASAGRSGGSSKTYRFRA
jgi:hypothetical protein